MSDAVAKLEMGPLLVRQRTIADQYRALEKVVQALHLSMAATTFDQAGRAKAKSELDARTEELMRLGRQMLELDVSVSAASSKSN